MGHSVVFAARRDITRSGENTPSRRETRPAGHFGGEGGSIGDVELVEHVAQMGVDGVRRDVEAAGNFFVGEAFGDELGDGEPVAVRLSQPVVARSRGPRTPRSYTEAPQFRAGPCGPGWGAHGVVVLQRFEEQGLRLFLASGGREDRSASSHVSARFTGRSPVRAIATASSISSGSPSTRPRQRRAALHGRHLGQGRAVLDECRHPVGELEVASGQRQPRERRSQVTVEVAVVELRIVEPEVTEKLVSPGVVVGRFGQPGGGDRDRFGAETGSLARQLGFEGASSSSARRRSPSPMAMVARCALAGATRIRSPCSWATRRPAVSPMRASSHAPVRNCVVAAMIMVSPRNRGDAALVVLVEGVVERGGRFAEAVRIGERHGVEVFGVAKPGGEILRCRRQGKGAAGEIERLAVSASAPHRLRVEWSGSRRSTRRHRRVRRC